MRKRTNHRAIVALGSNQGDREEYLRQAIAALQALPGVRVVAASGLFETPALRLDGVDESAPSYLNAAVKLESILQPEMLLGALHGIEASLGRVRTERWGDRTIDLDLIDFDGLTRNTESITLPHPRAQERAFVLAPWLQIDPEAELAGQGKVADLLAKTTDRVTEFSASPLFPAGDAR